MVAFITNFICNHKGAFSHTEELYMITYPDGGIVVCSREKISELMETFKAQGGAYKVLPVVHVSVADFKSTLGTLRRDYGARVLL